MCSRPGPLQRIHVQLFAAPWAVACRAPLSMEVSRQEYWGGVAGGCHFLFQGIFLTQGSKLQLLCLLPWQADSLPLLHLVADEFFSTSCHPGSPSRDFRVLQLQSTPLTDTNEMTAHPTELCNGCTCAPVPSFSSG